MDDDSAEYNALFADKNYERLMQGLTHGQGVWKRQSSTSDFITFKMHSLTPVAKVWYNFSCVRIKPTLHLSTITKDKTILLYAITKGFQFDIRSIIERGLIESTQGRCTGALIHPSLITLLCRLAKVPMLDSEERVQQRLPIPLPKAKFGTSGDSDEETDEDNAIATPSASDPKDSGPEVPSNSTQSLADHIHALTTRFDAYWDETQKHRVALSQDIDAIRAEMATICSNQDLITQ